MMIIDRFEVFVMGKFVFLFVRVDWFLTVGKKGSESIERNCEAAGSGSWSPGEKASCCDTKVYAGSCPSSGSSEGTPCSYVH